MRLSPLLLLPGAILVTGCRSAYPDGMVEFRNTFEVGNMTEAVGVAKAGYEAADTDKLVWALELANAQRLSGDVAGSIATFEAAEQMLNEIDAAPDYSLSGEGLSTFSNPYQLTYRGRNLDRIFASTYHALACIESGNPERARVPMRRTMFRIDDAKRIAGERSAIERAEAAEIRSEDSEFYVRLNSADVASARATVNSRFLGLPNYANALNPFAVWLHGVYFLHTAESASDLEIARKSLQTAAALVPGSAWIAEDLAAASKGTGRPDPGSQSTIVYVIHESGVAPYWSEQVITLPLIYADPRAPIVNIALPEIAPASQRLRPVEVSFGDAPRVQTNLLANVDSIVYAEFREEYPVVRNRAIASATMKAVAAYIANRAAQEHARRNSNDSGAQWVALATMVATNVYTTASAQADLRNWNSLPKQIEVSRMVVPRGSQIRLTGGAIVGAQPCTLPAAKAVLVTVRSITQGSPVAVRTGILQK